MNSWTSSTVAVELLIEIDQSAAIRIRDSLFVFGPSIWAGSLPKPNFDS